MKVIVFGGAGFLGSHTAEELTKHGYDVKIFDIKKSPYINNKQEMVVGDILDKKAVNNAIKDCDIVYNFAGMADLDESYKKPLLTIENNILGNTNILESCRRNKIKRYVFASTVYVYSDKGSFYSTSKKSCELIIENYRESFNVPYTILRYGSLYGTRAKDNNWIRKIIKQALMEKKITRHGDGNEIREYINVKDAAKLSVKILSKNYENRNLTITGNKSLRIKDLHIMVKEILGNDIKLEFLPSVSDTHYEITPYTFKPKVAKKLSSNEYYDIGQGIIECIYEIKKELDLDDEKS